MNPHDRYFAVPRHRFDIYGQPEDPVSLVYVEEFMGDIRPVKWGIISTNGAFVGRQSPSSGGGYKILLSSANVDQEALLDFGNRLTLDLHQGLIVEYRVKIVTAPDASEIRIGVMSQLISPFSYDGTKVNAWFLLRNTATDVQVETDPNLGSLNNDNNDVNLSLAQIVDTFHTFGIDFSDLFDVKFYINGERKLSIDANGEVEKFVMTHPGFEISTDRLVQPIIGCTKGGGTVETRIILDYFKAWQTR